MTLKCSFSILMALHALLGYAATNESASASAVPQKAAEREADNKLVDEMKGLVLVADVSMRNIDKFRTLGMQNGFGNNEPLCDFIATEKWVSKHGTAIKAGEEIRIGKATVVSATDGFGNTGTKLILDSAPPREGLVFYCYAFNKKDMSYWAIHKEELEKALKGVFHIGK